MFSAPLECHNEKCKGKTFWIDVHVGNVDGTLRITALKVICVTCGASEVITPKQEPHTPYLDTDKPRIPKEEGYKG